MLRLVVCGAILLAQTVNSESRIVKREACPSKYADLDPNHTGCLESSPLSISKLPMSRALKSQIVNLHNELRRSVDPPASSMQLMRWEPKLQELAGKWAMQCTTDHDKASARQLPGYPGLLVGQNIATGHANFTAAIASWNQEASNAWQYGWKYYSQSFGPYFQQIFDQVAKIGCAVARCNVTTQNATYTDYYVCNYAAGLDKVRVPYESGSTSCEKCPLTCKDGLCDCKGKVCANGGTLNVDTCRCMCAYGWRGGKCTARERKATTLAPGADMPLVCSEKYANQTPIHTMCLTDHPNATEVHLSEEVKQQIVDQHNRLRANVDPPPANMQKMVWDDLLALTARKWALRCEIGHDANRGEPAYPSTYIGQNAGQGHTNFSILIDRWYDEVNSHNLSYGDPYLVGTGHYFQVVYHESSRIGCGEAYCPHSPYKVFRVCNYGVRLDASGQPYQSGEPCGQCPDHCDSSGSLCDCGAKLCYHNSYLDVSTCQCKCRVGWKGEQCDEVDCPKIDDSWRCHNNYKKEDCGKNGYVKDPMFCPILCGVCPEPCSTVKCLNEGIVDLDTCKCKCSGLWTGDSCEICPGQDDPLCWTRDKSYCDNPYWKFTMTTSCPVKCGLCPGTCPDKDRDNCKYLQPKYCNDSYWHSYMKPFCPYKCGFCPATSS